MKILLLGKNGRLGWELLRSLAPLGPVHACGRESVDVENAASLSALLREVEADVVVNATGYTDVDRAEVEPDRAYAINALAPGVLSRAVRAQGALLVHYSTDYVFDGAGHEPWDELSRTAPISVYGRSKFDGEVEVQQSGCRHLILRSSWMYGPRGANFIKSILAAAAVRDELSVVDDQVGAPTSSALLADVTAHVIRATMNDDRLCGLYHVAAAGWTNWFDYSRRVIALARALGCPLRAGPDRVLPVSSQVYGSPARRPGNSRLQTSKIRASFGLEMPPWQSGVDRFVEEWVCDRGVGHRMGEAR